MFKIGRMRIVLFWVCLFFLGFSYGQENVIVQTSLSFDTVDVEEVFQLKFSIEGAKVLEHVDMPESSWFREYQVQIQDMFFR